MTAAAAVFPESVDISDKHTPPLSGGGLNTDVMFSSERDDYETPDDLFDYWDSIFGFDFDAAAEVHNAKCWLSIGPEADTLTQNWRGWGQTAWLNPPYGRGIGKFTEKALHETENGVTTVCLLPARTDTRWWHDTVAGHADYIQYIQGRLKFKGMANGAPFPSAIAIYFAKKEAI